MSRRLLLSYLALTLVLLAALEVPLAVNNNDRLRNELTTNLVRDGYTMAGYAEETVEGKGSVDLGQLATSYAQRTGGRVVIVDKSGRALADSQDDATSETFATRPEIIEALAGKVATGTRRSDTLDTDLLYAAVPIAASQGVEGAVRITYSTAQIDDRRRDYILTLLGVAAISLGVATVLGLVLARWVTRPVRRLERTAAELGEGDLTARATESTGPPEIRELAHTFNQMAHRLDELVRSQSAFVADASHQLRTPLAALQLRLENLQSELALPTAGSTDDALALDDLDAALVETARLARIVDGLLVLARADAAPGPNATEVVELSRVLRSRLATWEPIAAEHDVRLDADTVDLRARAAPDALAQVLDNLIANAIDASPPGTRVRIVATTADHGRDGIGDRVEVHVIDEGPGLSDEQRDRAFDRFWRAHPGPSALGGTGLGLAIARQLARSGGGDVELRPAPGTGLDAVVLLPRA